MLAADEHTLKRPNTKIRLNCDYCSKIFLTKSNFNNHMDEVHLKLKKFVCDTCGKLFATFTASQIFEQTCNKCP
uniref:C2H2-type domain-containing protein n=1 Tax=Trichogramma kaykai TaxID=54128 RepID=A0ABD2WJJ8_9HYME